MKATGNQAMTIHRVSREKIMVSCNIGLEDGQSIGLTLSLPNLPEQTVAQIERDVIQQAVKRLQMLLQD